MKPANPYTLIKNWSLDATPVHVVYPLKDESSDLSAAFPGIQSSITLYMLKNNKCYKKSTILTYTSITASIY